MCVEVHMHVYMDVHMYVCESAYFYRLQSLFLQPRGVKKEMVYGQSVASKCEIFS